MPLIQISIAAGRSDDEKRALMAAVTEAAQSSIGASKASIRVWINEFQDTEFMAGGELLADRRKSG